MTTQEKLAAIWAELTGVTEVSGDDNFVALGGDSISATLCVYRIHLVFNCEISLSAILDPDKTLAMLVTLVDRGVAQRTRPAQAEV